jgi:hypothetical protein
MAMGRVRLLVVPLDEPSYARAVTKALGKLPEDGLISLLDVVVVQKDQDGSVAAVPMSDLRAWEAKGTEFTVRGLIAIGIGGEGGIETGEHGPLIPDSDMHDVADPMASRWSALTMTGATERHGAELERREADVQRRETEVTAREAALTRRMEAARVILMAADERDAAADIRDAAADKRENDMERVRMLAAGEGAYGDDWPERRSAGPDRKHSKDERTAARDDRIHLTGGFHADDSDPT